MADERIEDISGGELTAIAADDKFVVLDKSDTTDDADGTSKFIEAATMGILETNNQTVTTTGITGAVGQLYVCTIAGLTANRNLTLPSASAGDRIGVHILDGDDTYALILIGAASQTINGGSAATEWSRVFIQGETVIFRCVATNTWIVEQDGRIPCKARMTRTTAQSISHNTATKVLLNNTTYDVGGIADPTTSNRINFRRTGKYLIQGLAGMQNIDDTEWLLVDIRESDGTTIRLTDETVYSPGANLTLRGQPADIVEWSEGTSASLYVHHIEGAAQSVQTGDDYYNPHLTALEIL